MNEELKDKVSKYLSKELKDSFYTYLDDGYNWEVIRVSKDELYLLIKEALDSMPD